MSKQYQIYGMGNALVDFEIETSSEELVKLGIDKGVMTLIDESKQDELFSFYKDSGHTRCCGGSAANTIIGAQTLGSKCFYSCKVGNDETGLFYKEDLLKSGVNSNLSSQPLADGKTGKCLVLITDDADRTMNTFLGVSSDIDYLQIDEKALLDSEYLYIEGYMASSPIALSASIQVMAFAKKNGIKTAFSLSDPNMVRFCKEGLDSIIGDGVDLLFCNLDEAIAYTQAANLEEALDKLLTFASTVVVTRGAEGAVIQNSDGRIEVQGNAVQAIDTTGAGDLFAGGFLHGLNCGFGLEKSGKLASFASAQLVTEFGARLSEEKLAVVRDYTENLNNQ